MQAARDRAPPIFLSPLFAAAVSDDGDTTNEYLAQFQIIHEFIARTNLISLRNPQDVVVRLIAVRVLTEIDFEVVGHVRLCNSEVKGSLLYTFPC